MKNENLFNSTVNFYNINNENFIEFLSKFYGDILEIKGNDESHKKLINELFLLYDEFNEKGIDEKILKDKIDLFLENNQIIKKLDKLKNDTEDIKTETNNISSQLANITHDKDYSNNSVLPIYDEPIISFVIDDGSKSSIDMFQSVFEENNIKPTLAIITDWVGNKGYLTLSQLKDYKKKGYEIVGHSATHSKDIYKNNGTNETVSSDLKKCHDFLKENGFNSEVIVYPWGNFSNANFYKNIARKYFNIGINAVAPNIINNKIPDTMYLERFFIQKNTYNLEQIKQKIDYAKNNNGWLIIGLHTNESECDTQLLRDVINYINASNIKIKNISDAFKIKGNKISIGEYDDIRSVYVNMKGEIKNGFNMERWIESKNYTVDRTPAEYENGLTLLNIPPNNNGGTPCTLLNFKGDNPDFYFQIKKDYNTNQLYVRQWNNATSSWGKFNKIGFGDVETFEIIERDGYSSDVRSIIKKVNRVLHCNISLVNPTRTGVFTHDTVLCKINKEIHSSFKGKIVPCVVTTGEGKVINAALNIKRDENDGKIRILCHGNLDISNIRWIDTEFTIIE